MRIPELSRSCPFVDFVDFAERDEFFAVASESFQVGTTLKLWPHAPRRRA